MSFGGMSRYDQWVTREPDYGGDEIADAWYQFCDETGLVPYEVDQLEHPDHAIYEAWERMMDLIRQRENRLEAEAWAEFERKQEESQARHDRWADETFG